MPYPRVDDIRMALLNRAESYSRNTGMPLTNISKAAVGDGSFLTRIRGGGNFRVRTYERAMAWLDEAEKGEETDHEHNGGAQ